MNDNIKEFFRKDKKGYYFNRKNNCQMLKGVNYSADRTRNDTAAEQAKKEPVAFSKVYSYINEFLEMIRKDNGFEEEITRIDHIRLGEKEHIIIDNGIVIRDSKWILPADWDENKRSYNTYDKKYDLIKAKFKLERASDLLWFKFTNKGHLAVVASSFDLNWRYDLSCGILVKEVGELFDESFVFVFPLTQQMIRTKAEPSSYLRRYKVSDLELAVGNYLIDKGVPIIDYYSHMGGNY